MRRETKCDEKESYLSIEKAEALPLIYVRVALRSKDVSFTLLRLLILSKVGLKLSDSRCQYTVHKQAHSSSIPIRPKRLCLLNENHPFLKCHSVSPQRGPSVNSSVADASPSPPVCLPASVVCLFCERTTLSLGLTLSCAHFIP